MLVIREEQMQAFAQKAKQEFEAETVRHISESAPGQCAILGEKKVGEIVSLGVERAEKYGFTNRGPVRFFVELMLMLGADFDTDPQYGWAAEILGATDAGDQMTRADQLHQRAMQHVDMLAEQVPELDREAWSKIVGSTTAAMTFIEEGTSNIHKEVPAGITILPGEGKRLVNPCSAEDACAPVAHTTVGATSTCPTPGPVASSDDSAKHPALAAGAPEKE